MQITAKLIQLLPVQSGTSKNGIWKKQDIVVETKGQYSKKICISIWGDKIYQSQLQLGNTLTIDFDLESREYNGKWFTDVKAWKIEVDGSKPHVGMSDSDPSDLSLGDDPNDVLPF